MPFMSITGNDHCLDTFDIQYIILCISFLTVYISRKVPKFLGTNKYLSIIIWGIIWGIILGIYMKGGMFYTCGSFS